MYILGLNCHMHNASAALIKDGKLLAAVEEERLNRKKFYGGFPEKAIRYCLQEAGISINDIEHVGFYYKPWLGVEKRALIMLCTLHHRIIQSTKQEEVSGGGFSDWLLMRKTPQMLKEVFGYKNRFHFLDHHLCHAASTFFLSPYEEAAILSVDLAGEINTTFFGAGRDNKIRHISEVEYPHSLGIFYAAITQYLGFQYNADEYKVMGLASYGKPDFYEDIRKLITVHSNGQFRLDLDYFVHHWGTRLKYSPKFTQLFGPARQPDEDPLQERFANIAASVQKVLNDVMLKLTDYLYQKTRLKRLCLAGGVALNCATNGILLKEGPFDEIYVQPAANDAGTSLGGAFYIYHSLLDKPRSFIMDNAYFGPSFSDEECKQAIESLKFPYKEMNNVAKETAQLLAQEKVIGWFQGRMEWGPRALGCRSILADPRKEEMKEIVNVKIKFREPFRPFAPSVLEEECSNYFDLKSPSPFMLFICKVQPEKKSIIPAVVHVDDTCRVQTVSQKINPLYWQLIKEFQGLTGVPVIMNTSFNVKTEPIVCTPENAINCFLNTEMDYLVLNRFLLNKGDILK